MSLTACLAVLLSLPQLDTPGVTYANLNAQPDQIVPTATPLLAVEGDRVLFRALDQVHGQELRIATPDQAQATLIADLSPGNGGVAFATAYPPATLPDGRFVMMLSVDGGGPLAYTPWVTDGTEAGTLELSDDPFVGPLVAFGGEVWFEDGFWRRTDGTPAGTVPVQITSAVPAPEDIPAGSRVVVSGDRLFFLGSVTGVGSSATNDLYSIDANGDLTRAGFSLVVGDAYGAVGEAVPGVGRALFLHTFRLPSGDLTAEWVISDGTPSGTDVVAPGLPFLDVAETSGDRVFFLGAHPVTGERSLFVSDGTPGGTGLASDLVVGGDDITRVPGGVVFAAEHGGTGFEPTFSSGDPATNVLLMETLPGDAALEWRHAYAASGHAFVAAAPAGTFLIEQQFSTDGTPSGTQSLPVAGAVMDTNSLPLGDGLVVAGASCTLIAPDGGLTSFGAVEVGPVDGSSNPERFARFGELAVFSADDGVHGIEPWVTDGTDAGTHMLADVNPGPGSSFPFDITVVGDQIAFLATDGSGQAEVWWSDGTEAGTRAVPMGGGQFEVTAIVESRGLLFAELFQQSPLLYAIARSDGTPEGTFRVTDGLYLGHYSTPTGGLRGSIQLTPARDFDSEFALFFGAVEAPGNENLELWATDGTVEGTQQVVEIAPGPQGSYPRMLQVAGGKLYAHAYHPAFGIEPWATDGTPEGTGFFADIAPHQTPVLNFAQFSTTWRDRYVFNVRVEGVPYGPWISDDSEVGARPITPDQAGPVDNGWALGHVTSDATSLTFSTNNTFLAPFGYWRLTDPDGTADAALTDFGFALSSGAADSTPWAIGSGGEQLFSKAEAGTTDPGNELWLARADGPAVLIDDIWPGPASSFPTRGVRVGADVLLGAVDPVLGDELRRYSLASLGGWAAEPIGRGCAPAGASTARLGASGSATLGDALTVELSAATPNAPVVWLLGTQLTLQPVDGACGLLLGDPLVLATGTSGVDGATELALTIPDQPSLLDACVRLQALTVEVGGELFGVARTSDGLEVVVGP